MLSEKDNLSSCPAMTPSLEKLDSFLERLISQLRVWPAHYCGSRSSGSYLARQLGMLGRYSGS